MARRDPEPSVAAEPQPERRYERETRIRDLYAKQLKEYRPDEQVLKTEPGYVDSPVRGDLRTLDSKNLIRVWEFEIVAAYEGLGQVLTYVALARLELNFDRQIRGVLAAFEFQPEVELAIEIMNLGVEVVRIPEALRLAGEIPPVEKPVAVARIPRLGEDH
jgi:hypothetical protein